MAGKQSKFEVLLQNAKGKKTVGSNVLKLAKNESNLFAFFASAHFLPRSFFCTLFFAPLIFFAMQKKRMQKNERSKK